MQNLPHEGISRGGDGTQKDGGDGELHDCISVGSGRYKLYSVQATNGRTNHTAGESKATAVELSASEAIRPGVLHSKGYQLKFGGYRNGDIGKPFS